MDNIPKVSEEEIRNALTGVKDPELGLDIVTLGLVRGISVDADGGGAEIVMTLTSPFCPFANELIESVEEAAGKLFAGAGKDAFIRVEISFDPPWEPPEEIRAMLGV